MPKNKVKTLFGKILFYLQETFVITEAGKKRPNLQSIAVALIMPAALCAIFWICSLLIFDTSATIKDAYLYSGQSAAVYDNYLLPDEQGRAGVGSALSSFNAYGQGGPNSKKRGKAVPATKYLAKQVILASEGGENFSGLPIGTRVVGLLLTALDSRRRSQSVEVELPYGASFKGLDVLPRKTRLRGSATSQGDRIDLIFSLGVYPNGYEFKIAAIALESEDFSPGLKGVNRSQVGLRSLATLGLKGVGVGAEVLTQKESLSDAGYPTAKASFQNAGYAGLAAVASDEAARQNRDLDPDDYSVIEAGQELIVELSASFLKQGEMK